MTSTVLFPCCCDFSVCFSADEAGVASPDEDADLVHLSCVLVGKLGCENLQPEVRLIHDKPNLHGYKTK